MKQEIFKDAVESNIFYDVSAQIQREHEAQSFVAESIENAIADCTTDEDDDDVNVYQWWAVSSHFAEAAATANEIIVETPFGYVWGRRTCGQGIDQDLNVQDIFKAMNLA